MKKVHKKDGKVCTCVPNVMREKKSHAIYHLVLIKICYGILFLLQTLFTVKPFNMNRNNKLIVIISRV